LVAIAVGVVTGGSPMLGIALAAAVVFALIVVWDLTLGVCLFLLVTFVDVVSNNQNLSLTKGAGAVLAGSWLAAMATGRGSRRSLTSHVPWLVVAVTAFLAWSGMSAFWAESPSAASRSTFRFALDAMLIPIVFWAVRQRKHVVWLFGVFVVGALLSVLWGLTQAKVVGGASAAQVGRLTGANVEANELATLLIVCTLFAIALALVLRRAPIPRTLAVLAAIAAMAAFFGTFSRGGLVALAVVLLAGCVYAGRSRPVFVALVLGVVLVGSVFLQDTSSGAVQRLTSASTSGRADIWKVGLRIVRANPIVGVGSGNYAVAEPHYLLISPGTIRSTDFIIDAPYPAHNIYLHVLAEMGVIGLALFLSVIVLSIRAAAEAVKLFRARGDRSLEILGRTLVIAILGILAADFFASDQYSKQLWLLLALGPALLALARRSPVALAKASRMQVPTGPLAPSDPTRQW
jgi:putative inorganic carbon (hco3(-)) transporter